MTRQGSRIPFQTAPSMKTTITRVNGLNLFKSETVIALKDVSVSGICFTSELDFEVGQYLTIELSLFTPTNQIFGEVVRKESKDSSYTYGFKITTADKTYHEYMSSYENYIRKETMNI
ncbi:PilZ domain-containing protein [Aquibacillus kalidii]|uniref:PilZ domain-containing protein n=1 Tax=Aquibacillus kalidii TaxID=2762597 RepID=UPI00164404F7|nr:PilZ domain-containing protein [Aquibacillus kalidii]